MSNIIEKYIHDVVRRLPENEQEEVRKELQSNIYDMLSDDPTEDEIKSVLYQLGSPAALAEKYRQNPRYLISPAIYNDYIHVLKWIIPLVGGILFLLGMLISTIEATSANTPLEIASNITNVLSKGFSMGFSGAVQALVWTTIGFVIAERTGYKFGQDKSEWKIEDLPQILPTNKYKIPLSDCVAELVLTVIFSAIAILYCAGNISFPFIILKIGDIQITQFFSSSFLSLCIPIIAFCAIFNVAECLIKIKNRRWTSVVCATVIINNLITVVITLFIFNRTDILSSEFTNFLRHQEWGEFDILKFSKGNPDQTILLIFAIIIIFACLLESGTAIYRTIKTSSISASESS